MIETLLIAMFGVFAASVLRGFTGFGFGLAAVPLLSLALPPAKVVPFVVVLQVIVGVAGLRQACAAVRLACRARIESRSCAGHPDRRRGADRIQRQSSPRWRSAA